MSADLVLFWILAPIAVVSAIGMVLQRKAVHSALLLIVNFGCLAIFFLLLGSPFLFVVQIAVYAGAIMVLFLFVIMLLGVDREESLTERIRAQRPLAVLLGAIVALEIFFAVRVGMHAQAAAAAKAVNGSPKALADVLFRDYFFPFEVTSILLIVAAVGAMVLTRKGVIAVQPKPGPEAAASSAQEKEPAA